MGIEEIELSNVRKVLDEYCAAFKERYKHHLLEDDKKATGVLISSVETSLKFGGTRIDVVLNVADYYRYVENGRKPGKFPPIAKIKQWIKDKPVIPRPDKDGRLPTENQLSFLISRSIANNGIEAGNQLKKTIEEMNRIYIDRLRAALDEDFGIYQLKILKDIDKMIKI